MFYFKNLEHSFQHLCSDLFIHSIESAFIKGVENKTYRLKDLILFLVLN